MVGLGENGRRDTQVMRDLRAHDVGHAHDRQYLQPSPHHLPVERYVHPDTFAMFERKLRRSVTHAAVGPWSDLPTTPTAGARCGCD